MIYDSLIFKNRSFDVEKLYAFGFKKLEEGFQYKTLILEDLFELTLFIDFNFKIDIKLVELASKEDYNLIFVKSAQGEFVGKVRSEVEKILEKIKDDCTTFNAFKSEYAALIINYIKEKYNAKAEFLWDKFPDCCIFRRNDKKGKWFCAIITAAKNKLGLKGNEILEVVDLKAKPETIEKIVDNKRFFKGYHMNKKHWFTIILDGSVDIKEIKKYIDESYESLA